MKGHLTLINLKILNVLPKYPKFQLSGCLFWTNQKAQASFSEYIMFFKMCTGLIFHSKKRQLNLPFWFITKLTFLEIDTSNGNGKGQNSNGKGQMSYPFCPLPLPLSVMVKAGQ